MPQKRTATAGYVENNLRSLIRAIADVQLPCPGSPMRAKLSVLLVVSAVCLAGLPVLLAQSGQTPVFRSGVALLEVDVSVVDGSGHPVENLRAPEFSVSVDGQ